MRQHDDNNKKLTYRPVPYPDDHVPVFQAKKVTVLQHYCTIRVNIAHRKVPS